MEPVLSPLDPYLDDPEFEAFAAAIAADPEDQAPRLVLADWFAERGDDAAESLARGLDTRRFLVQLAVARFEKATGTAIAELIGRLPDLFAATGRLLVDSFWSAAGPAGNADPETGERRPNRRHADRPPKATPKQRSRRRMK